MVCKNQNVKNLPLCVFKWVVRLGGIFVTLAKSISIFAKALNESVIEALISIELESTTTSKFAVNSAAAKVRFVIESVTFLVDRPNGFEVVVELTSILIS